MLYSKSLHGHIDAGRSNSTRGRASVSSTFVADGTFRLDVIGEFGSATVCGYRNCS